MFKLPLSFITMYKFLCIIFISLFTGSVSAQKIKIQEASEKVEEIVRPGMFVLLELDKKEVEKSWVKYLKKYGKPSTSNGVTMVQAADMKAISDYACRVFSKVEVAHTGSRVWWAIDLGAKFVSKESEAQYKGAEKMLYEFSLNAYREDVNRQIVDAESALLSATEIQEKEVEEGIALQEKIDNNAAQKADLEAKLAINKEDYARLIREIDNNLAEQKTALLNSETIKTTQHTNEGQLQTPEEKKALTEAVKVQKAKVNEGERLAKDLEKNKQTKVEMQNKQKKAATDLIEYSRQKEQNKLDQTAAAVDVEKMNKALDVVKAKMNKID